MEATQALYSYEQIFEREAHAPRIAVNDELELALQMELYDIFKDLLDEAENRIINIRPIVNRDEIWIQCRDRILDYFVAEVADYGDDRILRELNDVSDNQFNGYAEYIDTCFIYNGKLHSFIMRLRNIILKSSNRSQFISSLRRLEIRFRAVFNIEEHDDDDFSFEISDD